MSNYCNLITWLTNYKTFKQIDCDNCLFSLYQIYDTCYWDDPDDIPLNYKNILKRIEKFLKIKIFKNDSWCKTSDLLQERYFEYFNTVLKKKYFKKNTLYIISNIVEEDDTSSNNHIYEIPTEFKTKEDKKIFIDCVHELMALKHFKVVDRTDNDLKLKYVKQLFKNMKPKHLHIKSRKNDSGNGIVFKIKLTDDEILELTGKRSKNRLGAYLKAQFAPLTDDMHNRYGIDQNNGIISINCLEIRIKFISAKSSDRTIHVSKS